MNVGVKIGLAALGGAAIGSGIGMLIDEPNTAAGSALSAAGAGTMGVFGAGVVRNPRFSSPGFGLLGVGMGGLWAGLGITELFRANTGSSPVHVPYNPAEHLDEQPGVTHSLPSTPKPPAGYSTTDGHPPVGYSTTGPHPSTSDMLRGNGAGS